MSVFKINSVHIWRKWNHGHLSIALISLLQIKYAIYCLYTIYLFEFSIFSRVIELIMFYQVLSGKWWSRSGEIFVNSSRKRIWTRLVCIWPCVNLNNLNWLKSKYGFCYHVRWHAAISALQHSQTNKGQVCIK